MTVLRENVSAVLLVLLACSACGGGASGPGHLERLSLQAAPDAPALPEPSVVAVLEVPDGLAPWTLEGPQADVTTMADGANAVGGPGGFRVRVPGPPAASGFELVAVRGVFPGAHTLHLQVLGGGAPLVAVRATPSEESGAEQVHLFEFPELRRHNGQVEELVLSVRGPGGAVRAFELVDLPLGRALPLCEAPDMVPIGGESRRAVGLSSGRPLVALLAPGDGEELRVSVGQPAQLESGGASPRLRIRLRSQGRERTREVALQRDAQGAIPWRELGLPLEGLAGREVSATFELLADGAGDAAVALGMPRLVRRAADPATVLLVVSDTHRADYVGAYRQDAWLETPALDGLAERGVLFEDCYASTNATLPSHAAMMTGWYPRDTGVITNTSRLSAEARTLAEAFRDAGFLTFAVVSVGHLGVSTSGMAQGFDRMAEPLDITWPADDAWSALRSWLPDAEGQPLFVWLHLFDAHFPYEPPPAFDRRYYPRGRDPYDPSLPDPRLPEAVLPEAEALDMLHGLRDLDFPPAQYAAEVTYLDYVLGRALRHPRLARSIVAVTGDHGEVFAWRGTYFNHRGLWPETLRVPLLLAWPGGPAGVRVPRPVQNVDLGRTLLDLAGLAASEFPGENLATVLGASAGPDRPQFALHAHGNAASITLGRHSLVLALDEFASDTEMYLPRHELYLFDRFVEPDQRVDLQDEEPELTRRLREALVRWLQEGQGRSLVTSGQHSQQSLARLAALGYAVDAQPFEGEGWIDPACGCAACARYR